MKASNRELNEEEKEEKNREKMRWVCSAECGLAPPPEPSNCQMTVFLFDTSLRTQCVQSHTTGKSNTDHLHNTNTDSALMSFK